MVLLATSCGSKAEFTLGPPELNPTTAIIGQEVTVSVDVSNIGKAKGIYEAVLNVDGVNTETRSVTLTPGATQTVIFKLIKRETGTYTVKFGDQSRTLTVVKPAEFTVGSPSISPEEVVQGKETTISVDVGNIGGIEGNYSCTLALSGVNIQTKNVSIPPGGTKTVIFTFTPDKPGITEVTIGGQARTITVLKSASFILNSLEVPPTAVFGSAEKVKVSVSVTNTGEVEGTYRARLMVDDREIEFKDVTLQKSASQIVIFDFTPTKAGSQKVAVGELSANLKVYPAIPLLVLPAVGAVTDNGRTDYKDKIIWDFDWDDVPGATKYEIYVIGANATIPMINGETNTSSFHSVSDAYIANPNLNDWKWKVRAYANGLWSEWSEFRAFNVEPVNTDPPI
jgi:hypothetical protein